MFKKGAKNEINKYDICECHADERMVNLCLPSPTFQQPVRGNVQKKKGKRKQQKINDD